MWYLFVSLTVKFKLIDLNSNALEVEIFDHPSIVSYRLNGGIFDFFFFVGDTPEDVIKKYHELVGKPFLPPSWAFGFQLSRWGYQGLEEVQQTVARNLKHDIPFETQVKIRGGFLSGYPILREKFRSRGCKIPGIS